MSKKFFLSDGYINFNVMRDYFFCNPPGYIKCYTPNYNNFLCPRYVIIHYTGGGHHSGTAHWIEQPNASVSYHFMIARDGTLLQHVPVHNVAWHAGRSEWKGVGNLNQCSYGISLCNWGPLNYDEEQAGYIPVVSPFLKEPLQKKDVISIYDNEAQPNISHWERYTIPQYQTLNVLLYALCRHTRIEDVLMHSQVSPGRKVDPGPAFPYESTWCNFRSMLMF